MINSRSKKISIIFFLIISAVLFLTLILIRNRTNFFFNASSGNFPKDIQITNITDDTLTVTYITDGRVMGNVIFGTDQNNLDSFSIDDRDQLSQNSKPYNYHSITLRGLEPNTNYYFQINSGNKIYFNNNEPFTSKTGSIISSDPPAQIPAAGSVILQNGTNPPDGIIYLTLEGSQKLSALIENGNYIIPLNNLRNNSLNNYFIINSQSKINIEAYSSNQGTSASISSSNLSPVETIRLQENYKTSNSIYSPTIVTPSISNAPTITPMPESNQSILNFFDIFKF